MHLASRPLRTSAPLSRSSMDLHCQASLQNRIKSMFTALFNENGVDLTNEYCLGWAFSKTWKSESQTKKKEASKMRPRRYILFPSFLISLCPFPMHFPIIAFQPSIACLFGVILSIVILGVPIRSFFLLLFSPILLFSLPLIFSIVVLIQNDPILT